MTCRKYFAALLTAFVCSQAVVAQTLVVGTDVEGKPFNFAQDGTYVGFDQDLLAEIAKEVGFEYTVRPMDFGALIPALQTANIDMAISSIFMTDARKRVVDFSDVYYTSALGVLVPADDTATRSGADLAGKAIASVTGTASVTWLKENAPTAKVTLFPQFANVVMELQSGRAQALVYDYPYLAYYAKTEGGGTVKLLEKPVGDGIPVGIAFPKGSDLVDKVNRALKAIRADGRYDALYAKWFD